MTTRHTHLIHPSRTRQALGALAALTLVSGCSLSPGEEGRQDAAGTSSDAPGEVVLVTHDSFNLPEEVIAGFTEETGYELVVRPSGDAGELTNQLVLTADNPIGDAVYGIDNTFASRAVNEGVLAEYTPEQLPQSAQQYTLEGEGAAYLTPVDTGDVCVNIDDTWFAEAGIAPPETLEDLADPAYQGLFVTPGASTSSPGLAFLLATIGHFGQDGWQDYWADLVANDVRITSGWSDAYTVDFTAGGGDGDRPIVLSYASSPPFTIPEGGDTPTTSVLLQTCFGQTEYAGVLAGASNPEGAQALVDYLLSEPVQSALPQSMFVFPVDDTVELPPEWAKWAEVPTDPITLDPELIEANREEWVQTWADIATG